MNYSTILVIGSPTAFQQLSDTPSPDASLFALRWSRGVYEFFAKRHHRWCCVWLSVRNAHANLLGEFAALGLPLTLIADEEPDQIRRATALMAEYSNICGIALTPLDKEQCQSLMAKMRNAATARRFWNALESTLFPPKAPSILESIGLEGDRVVYAEAQNQYTDIYSPQTEKFLLTQTLGSLVQQLEAETPFGKSMPLLRVHDKYAVNPLHVSAVRPSESKRDYILTLSTGKELPLSRTYKHNLARLPVNVKRSRGGVEHPAEKTNNIFWCSVF